MHMLWIQTMSSMPYCKQWLNDKKIIILSHCMKYCPIHGCMYQPVHMLLMTALKWLTRSWENIPQQHMNKRWMVSYRNRIFNRNLSTAYVFTYIEHMPNSKTLQFKNIRGNFVRLATKSHHAIKYDPCKHKPYRTFISNAALGVLKPTSYQDNIS